MEETAESLSALLHKQNGRLDHLFDPIKTVLDNVELQEQLFGLLGYIRGPIIFGFVAPVVIMIIVRHE